jgi:hypothetical protein
VWGYFTDMFDYLVLSVVIDDAILCVHGGEFVCVCWLVVCWLPTTLVW